MQKLLPLLTILFLLSACTWNSTQKINIITPEYTTFCGRKAQSIREPPNISQKREKQTRIMQEARNRTHKTHILRGGKMTIRNYINIHDKDTFYGNNFTIKPFSMFGKDARSINGTRDNLYKKAKEVGARKIELTFFSLEKFAEKVDFNLEIKKVHCGFDGLYSYNSDWEITFFIDDAEFFKISKSCN